MKLTYDVLWEKNKTSSVGFVPDFDVNECVVYSTNALNFMLSRHE